MNLRNIKLIIDFIFIFLLELLFCLAKFFPKKSSLNCVLVIPSDNPGALGDEAMISVILRDYIPAGARVKFLGWQRAGDVREWGETIYLKRTPLSLFQLILALGAFDKVIVVGADVLDGYYSRFWSFFRLRVGRYCVDNDVDFIISPFSFNDSSTFLNRMLLRALSKKIPISVRDSISLARLNSLGIESRILPDLAFSYFDEPVSFEGGDADGFIVVNVSPLMFSSEEMKGKCIGSLIDLINNTPFSYKLLPHDSRTSVNDFTLLQEMFNSITNSARARTVLCDVPINTARVYSELKGASLVISGRMHLAIASLVLRKPVICFAYQDKFEGVLKDVGIPYTAIVKNPSESGILSLINYILKNYLMIVSRIDEGVSLNRSKHLIINK